MSDAKIPLPKYKCHKEVHAAKIVAVNRVPSIDNRPDTYQLALDVTGDDQVDGYVHVDHQFLAKHDPKPGGYFVQYEDGYQSYSPAQAFESGYARVLPPKPTTGKPAKD